MPLLRSIPIAILVLASTAPLASAQTYTAPPGASAVDEYLETVPAADGNRPAAGNARGGRVPSSALPTSARQRLDRLGSDGRRVARLVDLTSPASTSAQSRRDHGGTAIGGGSAGSRDNESLGGGGSGREGGRSGGSAGGRSSDSSGGGAGSAGSNRGSGTEPGRGIDRAARVGSPQSPVKAVVSAVTSPQGGMGPLLPVVLIASVIGGVAAAVIRGRRSV